MALFRILGFSADDNAWLFDSLQDLEHDPEKAAPDLIQGGNQFRDHAQTTSS